MLVTASLPVVLDDARDPRLIRAPITSRAPTRFAPHLRAMVERHTRRLVVVMPPRVLPHASLVEWRPAWRDDDVMVWHFRWLLDTPVCAQSLRDALEDWGPTAPRFGDDDRFALQLTMREALITLQRRVALD